MSKDMKRIAVIGGGLTGLTISNFISRDCDTEITIFEEKSEKKLLDKTSAKIVLSYSTVEILKKYNLWDKDSFRPNFIDKIHLSYSNSLGSTTISSHDENLDFLGAHIQTDFLKKKLIESIYSNKNIQLNSGTRILEINGENKKQIFYSKNSKNLHSEFDAIIFASGLDLLKDNYFNDKISKEYDQTALVFHLKGSKKSSSIAYERFTDDGVLALLPSEDDWLVIFSLHNSALKKYEEVSDIELTKKLQTLIGKKVGEINKISDRFKYPLSLSYYKKFSHSNVCLLGDACHKLHPIAGQSFNLTVRDCFILSNSLKMDNDTHTVFNNYQNLRYKEMKRIIKFTDFLADKIYRLPIRKFILGKIFLVLDFNKNVKKLAVGLITGSYLYKKNINNMKAYD